MDGCKIIINDGYLVVTMPNGDVIPKQQNVIIENDVDMKNISTVTITIIADTESIENIKE